MSTHWSDNQEQEALARGAEKLRFEPRAEAVRYDARSGRIVIELVGGTSFAFPPRLVEGLSGADARSIADVRIEGPGFSLHWPALDVDYSVSGLLKGVFGTAKWMAAHAGKARTDRKAAAARRNGQKGGRPRKAATAPDAPLTTAENIAHQYGLNPKSYRARLREAQLPWHGPNDRWEVDPASPEQRDMLRVAEDMRARQKELA